MKYTILALPMLAAMTAQAGSFYFGGYDTANGYYQASGTKSVSAQTYSTSGSDTNVVQVRGGTFTMTGGTTITKTGDTATSGDDTSFYGVNSAVFAGNSDSSTTAIVAMTNGTVSTSAKGANAFFAYGTGILYLDSIAITNTARASRGLIATGGGQIYASNMYIETQDETSSVIATDRGGGTVSVDGGSYVAKGNKCAIIYSAGTMSAYNATGSSASGEISVIEGDNSVTISNCTFTSGSTSRGLLLMQSGSGDASGTTPVMTIIDSTLTMTDSSAPLIEVATCVTADITLDNVELTVPSGVLMAVMEDSQWDTSGAVGNLTLKNGDYSGAVTVDDGYTGNVTVESTATWTLTADTTVSTLTVSGTVATNGYTLTYTTLSGSGSVVNTVGESGGSSGGDVVRLEANELVTWLMAVAETPLENTTVTQPTDDDSNVCYATASLESWLLSSSNLDAILAFCYGDGTSSTDVLTVDGTTFTFIPSERTAVTVTPVGTDDLTADFTADTVTLAETSTSGVYTASPVDTTVTQFFMRLMFEKGW